MKSVLVGEIYGGSKFYYIIDSRDRLSDGIIDHGSKQEVVNFWHTAISANDLVPLIKGKFNSYLWEGLEKDSPEKWKSIFLEKTEKVPDELLSGTPISTNVMKQQKKKKSISERAFSFKSIKQTQNTSILRGMIS